LIKRSFPTPELLCPAGDTEKLRAAVQYGADAVYLSGKRFGMRSAPKNFDSDELAQAVEYAHSKNVRVFVACNSLLSNDDINELSDFAPYLYDIGADAVIVSDIGGLDVVKKKAPGLETHISVQTGVFNHAAAKMFYELGAKRVILSRELSFEQIAEIRNKTPRELELEAFVHGAICVSFSGRCLLSDYMTDRSSVRGDCAQPCRWKYSLMEEKRPGEYFPVFEDDGGSYIFNSHDLCMAEYIPQLVEAGIDSFKIEGRAKSAYYTAMTANAYRAAIDAYVAAPNAFELPDWILPELCSVSHRPYSTGFYFGQAKGQQCYDCGGYIRDYLETGVITYFNNGMITVTEKNKFNKGDVLEIVSPGKRPAKYIVERMYLPDGTEIDTANHPEMTVLLPSDVAYVPGSIMRKQKI